MDGNQTFQLIMALISIISALVGGTGATIGMKASSKTKSLEEQLGEIKANQKNQKLINQDTKNDIRDGFKMVHEKIDKLTQILIKSAKEGN